jgi:hypothetical protein
MAVQTAYSQNHSPAYAGGRADSGPMHAIAALNVQGAEVPYGTFVARSTTAGDFTNLKAHDYTPAIRPAASTSQILGVALHDHAHNPANTDGILDDDMFSVGQRGRFYVRAEVAMDPTKPVFIRYASGAGGTVLGSIRDTADTATALDASAYVRCVGKCGAGEIVAVDVNIP